MKKRLTIIAALFASLIAFAQEGEILYTDFEPDIYEVYWHLQNVPYPDVYLDIDQDGTNDFWFMGEDDWGLMCSLVLRRDDWYAQNADWRFRLPYLLYDEDPDCPILGDTIQIGDTIANIGDSWYRAYRFFHYVHVGDIPHIAPDEHYYISVRKAVDGGYCYGWIDAIIYIPPENQVDDYQIYLTVCRMAYCTIPNYPLCLGQTSFAWGMEDHEATAATLHPNPTTGLVTITGKDLKRAEVVNTLGQRVAMVQGEGETMQIDIINLPAGVYFVNVTDGEGRKCVRKVVKE